VGAAVCYVVRAVASTEPLVESGSSNEACVEVRDIAAPPAPAGLAVLPRAGGLELLWSTSPAADVAGYRVYRTAPGGERERVAEVGVERSSWLDGTATRGAVYRYAVAAFDRSGNESEPSEAVEASPP
jgi:fibronectin type 3 domain-containing protein